MTSRQPHDQRLKTLLKEFIGEFLACFFPLWASRLNVASVECLDTEVLLAPPSGEARRLDLVGKFRLHPDAPTPCDEANDPERGVTLVLHVEVESGHSKARMPPRMFEYYVELRRRHSRPVLPIVLFLRAGGGVGWDFHQELVWEQPILQFHYATIGLADLPAKDFAMGENLVGAALSSLMRASPAERTLLHAEALQRIALAPLTDRQRFVLTECLKAYNDLDDAQRLTLESILNTPSYSEARPLMITTYERGLEAGLLRGQRDAALHLLAAKFGAIDDVIQRAVEEMSLERLRQLQVDVLHATSLEECMRGRLANA